MADSTAASARYDYDSFSITYSQGFSGGLVNITVSGAPGDWNAGDTIYLHATKDYIVPSGYESIVGGSIDFEYSYQDSDGYWHTIKSTGWDIRGDFGSGVASGSKLFEKGQTYGFQFTRTLTYAVFTYLGREPKRFDFDSFGVTIRKAGGFGNRGEVRIRVNVTQEVDINEGDVIYLHAKRDHVLTGDYDSYFGSISFMITIYNPDTGQWSVIETTGYGVDGTKFGHGDKTGQVLFANDGIYGYKLTRNLTGMKYKYLGEELPEVNGGMSFGFVYGPRVIHIPYTVRHLSTQKVIRFRAGQRVLHIPVTADLSRSTRILKFTAGQRVIHLSMSARLPVRTGADLMRISDLDHRTIGSLDSLTLSDIE